MAGEPITEPEDELTFEESLAKSKRFTLRGCTEKGQTNIPQTLLNFIHNIAAFCTDKTDNYYMDSKAMFEALDLIYKATDEQLNRKKGKPKKTELPPT